MNDNQLMARLAEANAYREEIPLPDTIWDPDLAFFEIERRMGMEPRESTNQPTVIGAPASEDRLGDKGLSTGTRQQARWWRRSRVAVAALTAAAVVLVVAAIAGWPDSGDDVAGDPAATINAYVDAYNARDIDGIMALFTEESVMSGLPWKREGVAGLEAIRSAELTDLAIAATENAYTISNVEVVGNTVTWDQVWTNQAGTEYCRRGTNAVVENGKIISWALGTKCEAGSQ